MIHKKYIFMILFTQVFLIFIQIYNHNNYLKYSFLMQKNEKIKNNLLKKIKILEYGGYQNTTKTAIKNYAQNHLQMKQITLSSLTKVSLQ
jgi:hypothetical protein